MRTSPNTAEGNPLVKLVALLVLGAGLLALFTGRGWFWMVFALGFAVLVPVVKLADDELSVMLGDAGSTQRSRGEPSPDRLETDVHESKQDALDALRDRYARGELTEAEFDRKVETLLETETLEAARERVQRRGEREADGETVRERT